ncbi:hypothetical protein BA70_10335 [Bacillus zhangzhouensis]|uniref:Uncharacterized protein n=1 Tax=Bacillus zhangzhouensis TaxID=1178540 RepID=A0A081LE48_9BACI|nr:hypothetical protein BA70_10335 [Bacillus zhangzhouensis]
MAVHRNMIHKGDDRFVLEHMDRCRPHNWGTFHFVRHCLFHHENQEQENQIIQLKRSVTPNVIEFF